MRPTVVAVKNKSQHTNTTTTATITTTKKRGSRSNVISVAGMRIIHLFFLHSLCLLVLLIHFATHVDGTHVQGVFHTHEFFKFIVKFGFQKLEAHAEQSQNFGYVYGNITSDEHFAAPVTLVVLDRATFIDFYNNRTRYNREKACNSMFSRLQRIAYDTDCNPHAKRDFLRRIPCPKGQLCADEDAPTNVMPGHQFTYVINEVPQPRFWYVAMVACYRNRTTCRWHAYNPIKINANYTTTTTNNNNSIELLQPSNNQNMDLLSQMILSHRIIYDIHVVNGHPNYSTSHPLTFEFSFDQQSLLEMYLIFLFVYIVLVPMQCYAVRLQKHPVTKLFTLSLLSEFISLVLITIHLGRFAANGIGDPHLQAAGDILDIFSRTTFMLILLLLAKGWAVTRQQISRTGWIILMTIWVPYCAFHVFLYIWNRTEVDIISDVDEYQTWPGRIVLILRTSFMMWFLYELRNTMKYEHSTKKLDFLLHFGASSLVWFIYLPIVAIVALQVSPMWRYKLLLGITNSADCLAYCVMTGLLWPNRAGQYLLLAGSKYAGMDELDEFNEAPHIVRERERRRNSPDDISINGGSTVGRGNGNIIATSACGGNVASGANSSGVSIGGRMHLSNEVCTDLLDADDLDIELLTDLNKNSHIVA